MDTVADSKPSGRRLSGEQRRAQLLRVASHLFARQGFSSTTMDEVAEQAGVTKPLLYQHFDSKKALYVELVDEIAHRVLKAVAIATAQAGGPREQVEFGLRAYFEILVQDTDAFRLLYDRNHGGDDDLGRAVRRVEHALVAGVDPLVDAGLDERHRHLIAAAMVGMTEGASISWMDSEYAKNLEDPQERLAEAQRLAVRVGGLMWAGLRAIHTDENPA
jgi:AcrR family transcriptional regulator